MQTIREGMRSRSVQDAQVIRSITHFEKFLLEGEFHLEHYREGVLIWKEDFKNTVMTIGKNLVLDTVLAGSAYTTVGPFMGLISSASFSAISAADTSASHAGWLEAGVANAPTYTIPRKTVVFSAASAGVKATSAALVFAITGTGTVKGCAIWTGTGALSTIANTAGTLLSAGLFTGGDRPVLNGDTINVSYSLAA
jgi:hypothetical protein